MRLNEEVINILRIIFFVIALVSLLFMLQFNVNFIVAMLLTFIILMICNIIAGYIINSLQRKVLDSDCDPERYLKMIDKQEKRFGKKESIVMRLNINRAAAHMLLGNYQTAKEYLEGIEKSYLSEKNGSYLIYIINLILCYYELGDIEKAELLYETELVQLCPITKRLRKSVELLIGERYYYLKNYEQSYNHLKSLLGCDLSKRQYLGVLYLLAQMDVLNGATDQASKRFRKVAKLGNKLWIAKASHEMLLKLDLEH